MATALAGNFEVNAALPLDHKTIKADIAARDAIPAIQRYIGMIVTVQDTNTTYKLSSPLTNSDWAVFGGGSGLTGVGNATSIAIWNSATDLGANIFFTRSNSTAVVFNSTGYTSGYDVDVVRYIDPAGNDGNLGITAGVGNAWLTPEYAIAQCQQMGPGRYIINCAAGTYTSVSFDVPDIISRGLDNSNLLSIIQFEGDQGTPANVVFENTSGTEIYAASTTTTLRLHGITLQGNTLNNGVAISHKSGKIILRNCVFNNYFTAHYSEGFSEVTIEAPVVLNSTYIAFSGIGTHLNGAENITHYAPSPSLQAPTTFSFKGGKLLFGFGKTYRLICPVAAQTGQLIRAKGTYINWGALNTFQTDDAECLYDIDSCPNDEGSTNTFMANGALSFCKIRDCSVYNSGTAVWWASPLPTEGVKLYGQAIFSSATILLLGTPPFGLADDYMTTYVQIQATPNYTVHALDARFTQPFFLTCLGELPQGYSNANLCPEGISDKPYYVFTAEFACKIILLRGFLDVTSGSGNTDTFYVAVNGSPTTMSVALANVQSNTSTANQVVLAAGDRVSFQATTHASTVAEDIHLQILVMRLP
jgi:hypothetical protein